jgi:hypothetical protein
MGRVDICTDHVRNWLDSGRTYRMLNTAALDPLRKRVLHCNRTNVNQSRRQRDRGETEVTPVKKSAAYPASVHRGGWPTFFLTPLKRFPTDLNRWDSQEITDGGVFGH